MRSTCLSWTLTLLTAAALTACGGGASDSPTIQASAAPAAVALEVQLGDDAPSVAAQPSFHAAAVELDAPGDGPAPHRTTARAGVATKGLTLAGLDDMQRRRALASGAGEAAPMAASTTVTTYTPAQIRAAYGLPTLPASTANLTAAQAAQLGAGQTIYIVNAKHDPNIVAELAAFNAQFGLPSCTTRTLAANASLPLAAASKSGCELVVAYTTTAGALTATAPAYDSGWATEIALDVQWAHATAPLARLVLIEAPDASVASLSKAVALANRMGAGVVSMSFGAGEGSWTSSYDNVFTGAGMSYLAATGDDGMAVSWPSVSTRVLAVGGTTLSYSGSGARSETTWSGTGGGTSTHVALPSYQSGTVGGYAKRAVADVAFNADPNSGQYVALISPGTTTTRWISAGGTSLATPQWAGLLAIANAMRVASAKTVLGQPHAAVYQQIGAVPAQYAAAFKDVATGSHGTCSNCAAKTGYDTPTGWGTPNASALLQSLSGASTSNSGSTTPAPITSGPQLTTTRLDGVAGKAFNGRIGYSAPGASSLSISISGAASGMSFSASNGGIVVAWARPVAGRTSLVITLKDNLGQTTTGTVAVTISAQ
jgi:subtilase family serine protease